jgi:hypothetical protein
LNPQNFAKNPAGLRLVFDSKRFIILVMSHRAKIALVYGIPLGILWAFFLIASGGPSHIDDSPFRDTLYTLFLYILPIGTAIFILHFSVTFCSRTQIIYTVFFALIGGALGPLLLHLSIISSDNEMSAIGYAFMPAVYCVGVAGCGIFAVTCLKLYEFFRRSKRIPTLAAEKNQSP